MDVRSKCKLSKLLIVVAIVGLLTPVAVFADAAADAAYEARIRKLEGQVRSLFNEMAKLKADRAKQPAAPAAPAVDQEQVARMVAKAIAESDVAPGDVPQWVKKMRWSGDFRYRHESLNANELEGDNLLNERRRNRIRARLQLDVKVDKEWDAVFRIASGSSETPTSTNQTLGESSSSGEAFSSKQLWLDLAYAIWHPDAYPDFRLTMGKIKNPFYRVGKNELIWDSDVNPEGGAFSYKKNLDGSTVASLVGGAFWLVERSIDADAGYFGIQGKLKRKFSNGSHLLGGVSYYDIGNIHSNAALGTVTFQGNSVKTVAGAPAYRYDYDLVEFFGEYGFRCGPMPVALFANYIENTVAAGSANTAYFFGVQLNKAKAPGSWQFKASYRDVQSDAVFGGLSDSDFIDGGTGGKGWELAYKYQMTKNINCALTYFIDVRDRRLLSSETSGGSGSQYFNRLQADLVFKFK
ncbi:MAG: DUF3373 family protein [Planctomycetes bacterium]|nr:DUF3373 family protein [Planctomycetota bacterium]